MSTRSERKARYKRRLCLNCGERGPHLVPACFGDPSIYTCTPNPALVASNRGLTQEGNA